MARQACCTLKLLYSNLDKWGSWAHLTAVSWHVWPQVPSLTPLLLRSPSGRLCTWRARCHEAGKMGKCGNAKSMDYDTKVYMYIYIYIYVYLYIYIMYNAALWLLWYTMQYYNVPYKTIWDNGDSIWYFIGCTDTSNYCTDIRSKNRIWYMWMKCKNHA